MQEQNGVAYCASTFSKEGSPPRTVFAAPAYVPVTIHRLQKRCSGSYASLRGCHC